MSRYTLAQGAAPAAESERLALIQRYQDPPTFRYLEALGVAQGWRCLDVGAGAGSVTTWLAERVGPTGSVLATDLELELLERVEHDNVEVRRHDVLTDPLPAGAFDLVHTRLVLTHLPARDDALRRMVAATRPGGGVMVGEIDFTTLALAEPSDVLERTIGGFDRAVREAGWDPGLGPRLPAMLERRGLKGVEGEAWQSYHRGGSASPAILAMTYERLRSLLLASGRVTERDLDEVKDLLASRELALLGPTLWTAWGRRSPVMRRRRPRWPRGPPPRWTASPVRPGCARRALRRRGRGRPSNALRSLGSRVGRTRAAAESNAPAPATKGSRKSSSRASAKPRSPVS
jgi:SAM-dependent methyltransferase